MADTTLVLVACAVTFILTAFASSFFAFVISRGGIDRAIADVRAMVPEAERVLKELGTVHGRAMATVRHAKKALDKPADEEDLLRVLDMPIVQGFLEQKGVDVAAIKAGDLSQLQNVGSQDAPPGVYM